MRQCGCVTGNGSQTWTRQCGFMMVYGAIALGPKCMHLFSASEGGLRLGHCQSIQPQCFSKDTHSEQISYQSPGYLVLKTVSMKSWALYRTSLTKSRSTQATVSTVAISSIYNVTSIGLHWRVRTLPNVLAVFSLYILALTQSPVQTKGQSMREDVKACNMELAHLLFPLSPGMCRSGMVGHLVRLQPSGTQSLRRKSQTQQWC